MNYEWIIVPLVGAVIGYSTNWIAIKMLFRPYQEKRIFGIKIPFTPGLIPKERKRIAMAMGQVVEEYLLTEEVILGVLTSDETKQNAREFLKGTLFQDSHEICLNKLWKNEEEMNVFIDKITKSVYDFLAQQAAMPDIKEKMSSLLKNNMMMGQMEEIMEQGEAAAKEIALRLLQNDKFSALVKSSIAELVNRKFGALGSMFARPDSIYGGIVDTVKEKMEEQSSSELFREIMKEIEASSYLQDIALQYAGDKLLLMDETHQEDHLKQVRTMIHRFFLRPIPVNPETEEKIIQKGMDWMEKMVENYGVKIIRQISLQRIVTEQINSFSVEFLEKMLLTITRKELQAITGLGALLGLIMSVILLFF